MREKLMCTNSHAYMQTFSHQHRNKSEEVKLWMVTFSLWHQTSCCFILRLWTCELWLSLLFSEVIIGELQFSLRVSEPAHGDSTGNGEEDAESLVWNNAIAPLLQKLESVAAGTAVLCDIWSNYITFKFIQIIEIIFCSLLGWTVFKSNHLGWGWGILCMFLLVLSFSYSFLFPVFQECF